jgi:glycosyltransferase involved in cell wall biosynthesis
LDETRVNAAGVGANKSCFAFPDIAATEHSGGEAVSTLRADLARFRGDNKLIGLMGVVDGRKGIFELLQLAHKAQGQPVRFAILGDAVSDPGREDVRQFERELARLRPDNLFYHRGRLPSEADFNAVIRDFDLLWLAYRNFPYSSNQLSKAAHFRIPVIVETGSLLAHRAATHRLGVGITASDADRSLATLLQFLQAPPLPQDGFAQYSRLHSREQLAKTLRSVVQ